MEALFEKGTPISADTETGAGTARLAPLLHGYLCLMFLDPVSVRS